MVKIKLSKPQQDVLKTCHEHQGTLRRWEGGFWTYPGAKELKGEYETPGVPEWYANTNTVRSLERIGLLERAHEYDEEWRDTRVTTPLGLAIAKTMAEASHV